MPRPIYVSALGIAVSALWDVGGYLDRVEDAEQLTENQSDKIDEIYSEKLR